MLVVLVLMSGFLASPVLAKADGDDKDKKKKTTQVAHTATSLRASLLYGGSTASPETPVSVAGGRR